ncbi:MAG: hypothetical protein RL014_198, partial [Pseudomonadota bacterium]
MDKSAAARTQGTLSPQTLLRISVVVACITIALKTL